MMYKWYNWSVTVGLWAATVAAHYSGFIDYLIMVDQTKLTLVIMGIVHLTSIVITVRTFKAAVSAGLLKQLEFTAANLPALGMLGTIIGLMIIIQDGIPEPTQLLIGVGTALTTTLMGLAGALVLGQQLELMDMANEKKD